MNKDISIWVVIGLLVVAIAAFHNQITASLKSIGIGNVATYRFVYFNTYDYPSLSQQPAAVSWSYSADHKLGTTTGVCNTNVEMFNPNEDILELDAPTAGFSYPISQMYATPSSQGVYIAVCEITLPASYYNTTQGTLTVQATGTNGWTSGVYTATLQVASEYSAQESGQPSPTIITIPLTNPSPTTTTTTTTVSTTTTTSPTTSTVPTTTTAPATTTIPQQTVCPSGYIYNVTNNLCYPTQSNIFQQIANFFNSIWQAIVNAFKI